MRHQPASLWPGARAATRHDGSLDWKEGNPGTGRDGRHLQPAPTHRAGGCAGKAIHGNVVGRKRRITKMENLLAFILRVMSARDPYTQEHSARVTDLALELAREINLPPVRTV